MTYIDAFYDRKKDTVNVVERLNGRKTFRTYRPEHYFYFEDKNSKSNTTSIFGDKVTKVTARNYREFQQELSAHSDKKIFESDINPLFKTLEKYYLDAESPIIRKASIDIETGFCEKRGFADPWDTHQQITAISIRFDDLGETITLVIPPPTLSTNEAENIASQFDNTIVYKNDKELLIDFYNIIDDVDVLYTWNGTFFDIPYIINRTKMVLDKEYVKKFCYWDQEPSIKEFERFGKTQKSYELVGRVHLDYLELYKKYTYHKQESYRLDFIGEYEVDERKIPYEGTLDQLYKNDFKKFIEYNRQDVALLSKIDDKLRYIELSNQLAHDSCVLLKHTLGTVAITDQSIIIEAHRNNKVVHNRKNSNTFNVDDEKDNEKIAGAWVIDPEPGLKEWIFVTDINSLYPSIMRSLNMSTETIIGQIRQTYTGQMITERFSNGAKTVADVWRDVFATLEYEEIINKTSTELVIDLEDGSELLMTAKEIHDMVFDKDSNLSISANGTLFRTDVKGIIPTLLDKWYSTRQEMQANEKNYENLLATEKDEEKIKEYLFWKKFWNKRQHARKINLNALYGAIVNAGSRFSDDRMGQSITLSGRTITKHMNSKGNQILTGEYAYASGANFYCDTDSAFFTLEPIVNELKSKGEFSEEVFIDIAQSVVDEINDSFYEFLEHNFNVSKEKCVIKCGREVSAYSGIFIKKKKYAIYYFDKEGDRKKDLKIMGIEIKRADTPKIIRDFLQETIKKVLSGSKEDEIIKFIREFRKQFKNLKPWELASPKGVNNLTLYKEKYVRKEKGVTIPGHVMASINWNMLKKMNNDQHSMDIVDGQRIAVCSLKKNPSGIKSVAYPIDQIRLPSWFCDLPFDRELMEDKLIDKKLNNVIGCLNYNISDSRIPQEVAELFGDE